MKTLFISFANKKPPWHAYLGRVLPQMSLTLRCQVQTHLHAAWDALTVRQELRQVLGSQDVPECGLSQQAGGEVGIDHIGHRRDGVTDSKVDHSIHGDGNRVLGQDLEEEEGITVPWWMVTLKDGDQRKSWILIMFDLLRRDVEGHGSQVNLHKGVGAGQNEENTCRDGMGGKQQQNTAKLTDL